MHRPRIHFLPSPPSQFPRHWRCGLSSRTSPRLSITKHSAYCWAAELAELEQVEVLSLTTGFRLTATVLLGGLGEVRIPGGEVFGFERWGHVVVTAPATVPSHRVACHRATLVQVDPRRNAALEICRQEVRPVLREPSFNPPPPRVVSREPVLQP